MNKCPKCGRPLKVHVALMLCCDPDAVPVSDETLIQGLRTGRVEGLGVDVSRVEAHCTHCEWKSATQTFTVELPVQDEDVPNKLLN